MLRCLHMDLNLLKKFATFLKSLVSFSLSLSGHNKASSPSITFETLHFSINITTATKLTAFQNFTTALLHYSVVDCAYCHPL